MCHILAMRLNIQISRLYDSKYRGGALSVTVEIVGNGIDDMSSNPGRRCLSLRSSALVRSMNPSDLPQDIVT